jgi:predicted alpha/beta hydrolase
VNSPRVLRDGEPTQVRFRALDGYELAGLLYAARGGERPARIAVLHPGAGVRAQSYWRFASFLAQAGIAVLLYDYRGIGSSRPRSLRGFRATIEDWAEHDCAGAIAWLRERFPGAPMLGVAHSIGTLLIGGAANSPEQAALLLIGAHTAYYGDYDPRYRLPMTALWHGLMPLVTRAMGYFPARRLGLGEDIPAQIAEQWAGRRIPELRPAVGDAGRERRQRLLDHCAALRRPTVVVSISDDAFATSAGTKRLLSYYPRLAPVKHVVFTPADAGTRHLGHFGFFRRAAGNVLWPRLLRLLGPQSSTG